MKRLYLAAAIAAAMTLGACSGCAPLAAITSDKPALSQTVLDEKALYAAEAALFGANTAAEAAVDNGLLTPGSPDAIKVADGLAQGHKALTAARAAYRVGDAAGFTARVAAAQAFVAQAWSLLPQKAL